jgi:hypothetical protein
VPIPPGHPVVMQARSVTQYPDIQLLPAVGNRRVFITKPYTVKCVFYVTDRSSDVRFSCPYSCSGVSRTDIFCVTSILCEYRQSYVISTVCLSLLSQLSNGKSDVTSYKQHTARIYSIFYFIIFYFGATNMVVLETSEVWTALEPLN